MKHIKLYEKYGVDYGTTPKVGDYVLVHIDKNDERNIGKKTLPHYDEYQEFINNNIGIIAHNYDNIEYEILYHNIPESFYYMFYIDTISVDVESIIECYETEEDILALLSAKKYNL